MLYNYLTVAVRHLMRNKLYTMISTLGLSVGITFCILAIVFIKHEYAFDAFHEHEAHIYRVYRTVSWPTGEEFAAIAPGPLANALKSIAGVDHATLLSTTGGLLRYQDQAVNEYGLMTDSSFFRMFSFPLVQGNAETIFDNPQSIVLTEPLAIRLFGDASTAMGQSLDVHYNNQFQPFTVTGIISSPPIHSTLQFAYILPAVIREDRATNWYNSFPATYVQLMPQTRPDEIVPQIQALVAEHTAGDQPTFDLQPLRDIHLNPDIYSAWYTSNPIYMYIFIGLSLLVLVIACINFINLTIARSTTRVKEIGIRKVLGARRTQLIKQIWSETILLSLIALFMGITLTELCLPLFSRLTGYPLQLPYQGWTLLIGVGLVVITCLIAGSYPAYILSRFQPVNLLKGEWKIRGVGPVNRALILLQFMLSCVLIVVTIVMARQLDFMQNKNLGFNDERIVMIPTHSSTRDIQTHRLLETYRAELAVYPDIINVTGALNFHNKVVDPSGRISFSGIAATRLIGPDEMSELPVTFIDYDFLETLDIEIAEGRAFSRDNPSDLEEAVLINEKMADVLGMENPIGQNLFKEYKNRTIIGVVKDFHFQTLHHDIAPLAVVLAQGTNQSFLYFLVKIQSDDMPATLNRLEETWLRIAPDLPFQYDFLEDNIALQYQTEEQWNQIIIYTAIMAILISCLGVFGLTALSVSQRTREIGIRKVLGASASAISMLFSREIFMLVILSNILAVPLAVYASSQWLQSFAYRVDLNVGMFLVSGGLVLMITLLTVSQQVIKAAHANPVESLRYE